MSSGKQPRTNPTLTGSSCFTTRLFMMWFLIVAQSGSHPADISLFIIVESTFPSPAWPLMLETGPGQKKYPKTQKRCRQWTEDSGWDSLPLQRLCQAEQLPRCYSNPLPGQISKPCLMHFFLWKSNTLWNQVAVNSVRQVTEEGTDECP